MTPSVAPTIDVLALDRLAALDARQARLVELRVFSGLTIEEACTRERDGESCHG